MLKLGKTPTSGRNDNTLLGIAKLPFIPIFTYLSSRR
jgi:hypothetical protein